MPVGSQSMSTSQDAMEDSCSPIVDVSKNVRYLRGRLLGKGGFAKVYEIAHPLTGFHYADKIISKEIFSKRKSTQEKVRREIALHRRLSAGHPNIVQFVNCFEDPRSIHIILEFCSMKSLLHLLRKHKVLFETDVRGYIAQICSGVQYIHSRDILHRDLKLGNMFLAAGGVVKIGDFGLATCISESSSSSAVPSSDGGHGNGNGNGTVTLCGTPNYIAPEVLLKRGHCVQSDYWAIGCMTYALLTGNPPFETKSLKETYEKILSNHYFVPDSLSRAARSFIGRLLHPQPARRGSLSNAAGPQESIFCDEFLRAADAMIQLQQKLPTDTKKDSWQKFLMRVKSQLTSVFPMGVGAGAGAGVGKQPPTPPFFVTKWIDYSNKFGFGYQLNDKTIGVLFNDKSKVTADYRRDVVAFTDVAGRTDQFSSRRPIAREFLSQARLLSHFRQYMEENLADSTTTSATAAATSVEPGGGGGGGGVSMAPELLHWHRTDNCVIMLLSNLAIQVNFLREHQKIIFWDQGPGSSIGVALLTARDQLPGGTEVLKSLSDSCIDIIEYLHNTMPAVK